MLYNRLREEKLIPIFMNFSNITTVPKRGSKLDPENERGIFRVSVLRSILMRMIYNEKYSIIDSNMSDCQMGGRKGKGCKSNIWIINGIIHEVLKSKKMKPVMLQIYDYKQMFDSINLQEAISDIYNVGVDDDSLALIYDANKDIKMSVKTPSGLTERQTINNIVLQGDTWGSILASVQVDAIGKDVVEAGLGYQYKDILDISMLGLVDDAIGVTEAGFKAVQMNEIINLKSAEKGLQFGPSKCKTIFVGKQHEMFLDNDLYVDKWEVDFEENIETNEEKLIETYVGQTKIGKTISQKYLGFVISGTGDNMANIEAVRKKSIGVVQKIMNKLETLGLRNYFFECAMIFMNSILRPSILYACETYYNLTETQTRRIERIEEGFLRQVFKTSKGCPIVQLYLEAGQVPARFECQRMRLLYMKNILQQNEDSMIYKMFYLQIEKPSRGDWASTCLEDLRKLGIKESLSQIKEMKKEKFNSILKTKMKENALKYLNQKKGKKGNEISYECFEMAEYLLPYNKMSVSQKRRMYEIRNKMVDIPENFSSDIIETQCLCGEREIMSHIYYCDLLSKNKREKILYDKIYNGNLFEQIEVYQRFEENFEVRDKIKNGCKNVKENEMKQNKKRKRQKTESPCDPFVDPLHCKKSSIG